MVNEYRKTIDKIRPTKLFVRNASSIEEFDKQVRIEYDHRKQMTTVERFEYSYEGSVVIDTIVAVNKSSREIYIRNNFRTRG